MARETHRLTPAGWFAAVLVITLALAVAALSWLALNRAPAAPESVAPSVVKPSPTAPEPQATVPSPIPTSVATVAPDDVRFLASGASGVLWRAVAGNCRNGVPPVLERSADAGVTWTDVTPSYLGIAQIDDVHDLLGTEAEIAGLTGDSCGSQVVRTYTQGQFWEVNAGAAASWPRLDGAGIVIGVPSGPRNPPCVDPTMLRGAGPAAIAQCGDEAWMTGDIGVSEWAAVPIAGVLAVELDGADALIAHVDASCDGVAVSRFSLQDGSPAAIGCAESASPTDPVAVTATTTAGALLWSGDALVAVG